MTSYYLNISFIYMCMFKQCGLNADLREIQSPSEHTILRLSGPIVSYLGSEWKGADYNYDRPVTNAILL